VPSCETPTSEPSEQPIGRDLEFDHERDVRVKARCEAEALREETMRRDGNLAELRRRIGKRYTTCTLSNYEITSDRQQSTVRQVLEYAANIAENVKNGAGIVLYGPPGTGKDHLLAALMQLAIANHGFTVRWVNGLEVFGEVRDRIGTGAKEESFVKDYLKPNILAVSDPIPPWGPITQFQATTLFRIIDGRYRSLKPTWVTLNVSQGGEAIERLGATIVDRLRHGSLALYFDWESYRK